jgi:uncharacterized protein
MNHVLLSRADINDGQSATNIPDWGRSIFKEFEQSMSSNDPSFPCIFGVIGFHSDRLRYGFFDSPTTRTDLMKLNNALVAYTTTARDIGNNTSFVAFFRPDTEVQSMAAYQDRFWSVLQFQHENDPQGWPASIPTHADDPMWEFCFNGEPLFVVCATPAHNSRLSRRAVSFTLTFQPRWVFDGLEGHTARGRAAREAIRQRLVRYDSVAPHAVLGSYTDPTNREWLQYFLPDTNTVDATECPLRLSGSKKKRVEGVDHDATSGPDNSAWAFGGSGAGHSEHAA